MRFFVLVLAALGLLYVLNLALLVGAHRVWWRRRWVRRIAMVVPVLVALGLSTWALAHEHGAVAWVAVGAGLTSMIFSQLVALLLALLGASILRAALFLWGDVQHRLQARAQDRTVPFPGSRPAPEQLAAATALDGKAASPDRRHFLRTSLAVLPAMSVAAAAGGTLLSAQSPGLPQIPLYYPDLPPALQGLRILHLSDLHVGPYVGLEDVERLVERAAALQPDLVVVTGDICDHLPQYLDTLRRIEALQAPLGIYASLGNHEYFRGLRAVRKCFDDSTIPLLVEQGVRIAVGDSHLYVAGADDPRYLADPTAHARLRASVEASLDGAPSDAFHLLMSHRSQAFDTAAPLGVNLTLSGHTHGFQLGLGGRSLFERFMPQNYIWGHYGGGATQLYTSAGVGHWFPFRLGCAPEAPLFTLTATEPV